MMRIDCPTCWACGEHAPRDLCEYCDAPPWKGVVTADACDGPGVYLLAAQCGLWKIGVSGRSVRRRAGELVSKAGRRGECVVVMGCMPRASERVERWLHAQFADCRDRSWATAEHLPNATEWFWPTLGLYALLANEYVVDALEPEFWVSA